MDFTLNDREIYFRDKVRNFIDSEIRPRQDAYDAHQRSADPWAPNPVVEEVKAKAKAAGLWNFFMPPHSGQEHVDDSFEFVGTQLTNLEYALCAEEMGKVSWSGECFNCSAPDTGNMEVLHRYGTRAQKDRWLKPLMEGEIRSIFFMTEPEVASSDATNIETSIVRDDDEYVINGRKWWSSGMGDPRCAVGILMGKTNPGAARHEQQSQILVPLDTPGIHVEQLLSVYGYKHPPHGHGQVRFENVRVPVENILLGEGRGFEIAQGRLGPGRIHHCMRSVGVAETAIEAMAKRLLTRIAFGRRISEFSVWEERIARARIDIEMTRLLCLKAADMMDRAGNKSAHLEIAMVKVQAPIMALKILDDAVQAHGGGGVSAEFRLAYDWAAMRTLRIADGPDEVHNRTIARMEFGKYKELKADRTSSGDIGVSR